jgi:hypothetical protein
MFAVIQHGQVTQIVQPYTAFKIGDKAFSNRYLANSTKEERLAEGIYEIIEGDQKDERFYWVSPAQYTVMSDHVQTRYDAKPKQLEDATETPEGATEPVTTKGLKSQWIAQAKAAAGSALAATDWMVIRNIERSVEIPAAVAAERAKIVADCDAKEVAIAACTTVDELIAVVAPVQVGQGI